jgi:hypothetical protein
MVRKGKDTASTVEQHPGGGHITVTQQQSRYALDAVDAPASKEVGVFLCHQHIADTILTMLDTCERPINIRSRSRVAVAYNVAFG